MVEKAAEKVVLQAPPWLAGLLTPLLARMAARQLAAKYPGLSHGEIAQRMREQLGHPPSDEEARFIDAALARLPAAASAAPKMADRTSAVVLVLANLVPLAGVVFWRWDAFALIALFWMENVVVGVFFILRMLFADPRDGALWLGKVFMVPFFCFHYGMFTAIHGVFVFSMLGGRRYDVPGLSVLEPAARAAADYGLWLPLAVLFASHFFSFCWNYLYCGEFRRVALGELMSRPYGRVVVLHVAIILGGFGAMALGSPVWALLVLVALKIGLDLTAHLKEHSKAQA